MNTAELFTRIMVWCQLGSHGQLTEYWTKTMWYMNTMEFYLAMKKNEMCHLQDNETRDNCVRDRNQTQRNRLSFYGQNLHVYPTYYMHTCTLLVYANRMVTKWQKEWFQWELEGWPGRTVVMNVRLDSLVKHMYKCHTEALFCMLTKKLKYKY